MRKKLIYSLVVSLISITRVYSQEVILYKRVDSVKLHMEVYLPENIDRATNYPALVFFFGGGWKGGSIHQFKKQAEYFTKRGMVCFLVDYRVENRHMTTPFESLKDAKSAIRFIRANYEKFHIDPSRITASGGSAGGHLAVATALIEDYNESTDDLMVSSIPDALILYNPVIDNGPGGYGFERIGDAYKSFSPLHNIREGAPPTIIFLGTKDNLIPVETVKYYQIVMQKVGSLCEVVLYEGRGHGFFNYDRHFEYYKKTLIETDRFLQYLGYIEKEPVIEIR